MYSEFHRTQWGPANTVILPNNFESSNRTETVLRLTNDQSHGITKKYSHWLEGLGGHLC